MNAAFLNVQASVFVKWLLYYEEAFLWWQLASGCSVHLERVFLSPTCCLSSDKQCLVIVVGQGQDTHQGYLY